MMAIAGVVLIQHPLHLLLLKSSFSGTFVGAALSREGRWIGILSACPCIAMLHHSSQVQKIWWWHATA